MKKNLYGIIALASCAFYQPAQAQVGLSQEEMNAFFECKTLELCSEEDGQAPSVFEFKRIETGVRQFLNEADYQAFTKGNQAIRYVWPITDDPQDKRLDMAVGLCPLPVGAGADSLWNCDRLLFVSLSWTKSIFDAVEDYEANEDELDLKYPGYSSGTIIVKEILGAQGQGGKLQIFYVNSPNKEFSYWQEGMSDKKIMRSNSDIPQNVQQACGSKIRNQGLTACMQALEQTFGKGK